MRLRRDTARTVAGDVQVVALVPSVEPDVVVSEERVANPVDPSIGDGHRSDLGVVKREASEIASCDGLCVDREVGLRARL